MSRLRLIGLLALFLSRFSLRMFSREMKTTHNNVYGHIIIQCQKGRFMGFKDAITQTKQHVSILFFLSAKKIEAIKKTLIGETNNFGVLYTVKYKMTSNSKSHSKTTETPEIIKYGR